MSILNEARPEQSAVGLDAVRIIDCDAHFTEPSDLWTSRAPAALADRVPTHRTVNGVTGWYLDGQSWSTIGGNTIRRGGDKVLGEHSAQPFEEVDPSAYSVKERLALMDAIGIDTQIVYPNGVGFASNHIFSIEDPDVRIAVLEIYNDFLIDVQEESCRRLLPQAMLPIWDMDLTVKELHRLLDKGITGFTLSDKPELLGLPELVQPYFEPMWQILNDARAVANFHIAAGARREDIEALRKSIRRTGNDDNQPAQPAPRSDLNPAWESLGRQRRLAISATLGFMSNARIIANLCMSDLFDRYPNLKIVSAESGIGWIPFILETLEWQFDETVTDPVERGTQKRRPVEYFRDHLYVMFWFERVGPAYLIEEIGVNNVLVETDIPHPTCLYPAPREHLLRSVGHLDPYVQRRILQDNAAELYGIPI